VSPGKGSTFACLEGMKHLPQCIPGKKRGYVGETTEGEMSGGARVGREGCG